MRVRDAALRCGIDCRGMAQETETLGIVVIVKREGSW